MGFDLLGPGAGGFGTAFPPDLPNPFGFDLKGPGRGGYGFNFLVLPTGEVFEPFDALEIPTALLAHIRHQKPTRRGLVPAIAWGRSLGLTLGLDMGSAGVEAITGSLSIRWAQLAILETNRAFGWGFTDPAEAGIAGVWQNTLPATLSYSPAWSEPEPTGSETEMPWQAVNPETIFWEIQQAAPEPAEVMSRATWGDSDHVFPDSAIVWGTTRQPPTLLPNPEIYKPPGPGPDPREPIYHPPPGDQVDLPMFCRLRETPGDQVALTFARIPCMRYDIVTENTIVLRNPTTGEEYPCIALNISGDMGSYVDSFTATLPAEAIQILTGPLEVEAEINGTTHLVIIEEWTRGIEWGQARKDTFQVRGRSIAAELDAPYAAPRSYVETETRTAMQLMQRELPLDGSWTISAHPAWIPPTNDYTIPGGVWSYVEQTPLQAIAKIASATKAVVQQVPGRRELLIVPRHTIDPWKQATTPADTEIDFGMLTGASGKFQATARANGVIVTGEENGVIVTCRRTGTAGDPWLITVTDPLITDAQAGLQRGRAELAETGKREVYSVTNALTTDPGGPGLITPGELVTVYETMTEFWNGQAISWSIRASVTEKGIEVWATTALERYVDE